MVKSSCSNSQFCFTRKKKKKKKFVKVPHVHDLEGVSTSLQLVSGKYYMPWLLVYCPRLHALASRLSIVFLRRLRIYGVLKKSISMMSSCNLTSQHPSIKHIVINLIYYHIIIKPSRFQVFYFILICMIQAHFE